MTVGQLIDKLKDLDYKLPVLIEGTETQCGSEYTGCWDETVFRKVVAVNDLETRIVLQQEKE